MAKFKSESSGFNGRKEGDPHPDWKVNYDYYKRCTFKTKPPEPEYHAEIPTHVTFAFKQPVSYAVKSLIGYEVKEYEVGMTLLINFHQTAGDFKKDLEAFAMKYQGLVLPEPVRHRLFGHD